MLVRLSSAALGTFPAPLERSRSPLSSHKQKRLVRVMCQIKRLLHNLGER
jgi:hypothetical protein